MTGRATSEWIGKTPDSKIPDYVKLRIWKREDGRCYLTGKKLRPPADAFDYEHKIALALWTGEGHGNRESNIFLAWRPAHREKTKQDVREKAESDRVLKKHIGLGKSSRRLSGPGFHPAPKQRSATRKIEKWSLL
jgi:5-methylcytosine-specific restriction protein A